MRKVPSPSFGIAMPWVLMFSMGAPNDRGREMAAGNTKQRGWLIGGIRRANSDSLPEGADANQDRVRGTMAKPGDALQRWLQTHGLLAIGLGVLGVAIALSVLFVVGGY